MFRSAVLMSIASGVMGWYTPTHLYVPAPSATCTGIQSNVDFHGNVEGTPITGVESAADCCDLCAADSSCKYWSLWESGKTCYKKTSDMGKVSAKDHTSGASPDTPPSGNVCNVKNYNNDITKALSHCCSKGGGQVVIPAGVTSTAKPFELGCDNLELHIEAGGMLKASTNRKDYPTNRWFTINKRKNVALTGKGTIDGSGSIWWPDASTTTHPDMIYFTECTDVLIQDVTIQNSGKLTLPLKECTNVQIFDVYMNNPYTSSSKNLDCIDPSGTNIHIKGCTLHCGDDNVAVKGPSSGVLVEDCIFQTGHGASIGSINNVKVTNVTFRNIAMDGGDNGCRVKAYNTPGGYISDILFQNITMKNVKHPLVLDGTYGLADTGRNTTTLKSTITKITFKDITVASSRGTSTLVCTKDEPCTDIVLDNVQTDADVSCNYVHGTIKNTVTPSALKACIQK